MLNMIGKQVKIVSGRDAFDFETKPNGVLKTLNEKGARYTMQLDPKAGLIAYITVEEEISVPQSVAEEYELVGELHRCVECPFFVRPTDGRRKYTRCPNAHRLTSADGKCCDSFYEQLDKGMLTLIEVG